MATQPIEADSPPVTLPGTIPPAPAVMRILDRFNRDELGNTIEVLVALLDVMDAPADPDEPDFQSTDDGLPGDPKDAELCGDEKDAAWIELQTMRGSQKRGPNIASLYEDDEEDDASGQYDEDCYTGTLPQGYGPGCKISDDDFEHDGTEPDTGGHCGVYGEDQSQTPSLPPISRNGFLMTPL